MSHDILGPSSTGNRVWTREWVVADRLSASVQALDSLHDEGERCHAIGRTYYAWAHGIA
jgi:hypothetical protein